MDQIDLTKTVNVSELPPFLKFLAILFSILAIIILGYSLTLRYFPQYELPNFPFFPYIIAFSILIIFAVKKINYVFLFLILVNFLTPHFRNLFYSYLDLTIYKVLFTFLFIASFHSFIIIIQSFFTRSFLSKWDTITVKDFTFATYKAFVPTFVFYFAIMSPFYLGAIKPSADETIEVAKIQTDPIFGDLSRITAENADFEIARQYFNDAKEVVSSGTIKDLKQSIELYNKALVLVPEFSTAYAEIAYSYGSLYRIEKSLDKKSKNAEYFLNKAQVAIDAAKEKAPDNYTIYAIESIINLFSGNKKIAKSMLEKAMELLGEDGVNDRILLAMAHLEKSDAQSLKYLITIQEKINSNSAELHNLLAVKYYQVGNLEKTKEMAERAIRLNPKYDEPYLNLALVAESRSEKRSIYSKVIYMKSDYTTKAKHFIKILKWQYYLKILFWILFPIFLIHFLYLLGSQIQKKQKDRAKLRSLMIKYFLIFTIILGSFEYYIHFHDPINSLTHLFPIKFPLF